MLADFVLELQKIGLNLNPEKCKVQCSKNAGGSARKLQVGELRFDIVGREEGVKILGTLLTLD